MKEEIEDQAALLDLIYEHLPKEFKDTKDVPLPLETYRMVFIDDKKEQPNDN